MDQLKVDSIHIITGLQCGGAETALLRLTQEMLSQGHMPLVLFVVHGSMVAKFKQAGIQTMQIPLNPLKFIKSLLSLRKIALKTPLVIQGWMYHGNLLALIIKFICFQNSVIVWNIRQSLTTLKYEKWTTKLIIYLSVFLSRFSKSTVCNSKVALLQHKKLGFKGEFAYIPNGLELPSLNEKSETPLSEIISNPSHLPIIINIGRLHRDKGQDLLIKAALTLLQRGGLSHYVFVGRNVETLEPMISDEYKKYFHFLGEVSDVFSYLEQSDIFISASRAEGFSNVIAEAMLMGKYCIVTDVGSSSEIIGNCGAVIPPESSDAMVIEISKALVISPGEIKEYGSLASSRIKEKFSVEQMCENYLNLYKELRK